MMVMPMGLQVDMVGGVCDLVVVWWVLGLTLLRVACVWLWFFVLFVVFYVELVVVLMLRRWRVSLWFWVLIFVFVCLAFSCVVLCANIFVCLRCDYWFW